MSIQRVMSRGQALLLALAVFVTGCAGPSTITPSPCPQSVGAATPPPGQYVDQHVVIDYDELVPSGHPRRGVNQGYVRQVTETPVLLEQVYYDATNGHQKAAWLVCELEATARDGGRQIARYLASLRCATLASCKARWDELPFSRDTASGQRILSELAAGFHQEAERLTIRDELVGNALMVLVGAHIASRARLGAPRPAGSGNAGGSVTHGQAAASAAGARAFGGLSRAAEFGIQPYNRLVKSLKGTGLQAHHLPTICSNGGSQLSWDRVCDKCQQWQSPQQSTSSSPMLGAH